VVSSQLPVMPSRISPLSSVGQFNTQRQGALLSGQATPNPSASSVVLPGTRMSSFAPGMSLSLGGDKPQTALDMRAQTQARQNALFRNSTDFTTAMIAVKQRMKAQLGNRTIANGALMRRPVTAGGDIVEVGHGKYLRADAAQGFVNLATAFRQATGGNLGITEGFRSNERQAQLYEAYRTGRSNIVAAAPGHSHHNSGVAVDLNGYGGSTNSPQFRWLLQNAGKYGWSWAEGRAAGEPWHWVYVGGGR